MVEKIKLGVVSTATPLLNIKLVEKNTLRMLKALKELKLEIVSVDDLVTSSKEAKLAAEKLVKEDAELLVCSFMLGFQ